MAWFIAIFLIACFLIVVALTVGRAIHDMDGEPEEPRRKKSVELRTRRPYMGERTW